MSQELNQDELNALADLLVISQKAKAREALCIKIGISYYKELGFIYESSDSSFAINLINHLNEVGNTKAICQLCCKELSSIFQGDRESFLKEIAVKLNCNHEFDSLPRYKDFDHIPSNENPLPISGDKSLFEKLVKAKKKILASRIIFLIISTLTASAIYTYFYYWAPEVWSVVKDTVQVKGTNNPWLAGMPDGTSSGTCKNLVWSGNRGKVFDTAPNASPREVKGIPLKPGGYITFTATNPADYYNPEGNYNQIQQVDGGGGHGISDIRSPSGSLLGVFLGAEQPDKDPAPRSLDFGSLEQRSYLTLSPKLKQVFFIGDGRISMGRKKRVIVPPGATRLYLGTMDSCYWSDNKGAIDVEVTSGK